jgi:hypothetical protein
VDRVDGVGSGGELLVRVRAVPVDGAANRSLVRLLASAAGIPPAAVVLERGQTARHKVLLLRGLLPEVPERLRAAYPGLDLRCASPRQRR